MDEFLPWLIIAIFTLVVSIQGVIHWVLDYRHFTHDIVEVCQKRGYIQNDKIRVLCQIEKTKE